MYDSLRVMKLTKSICKLYTKFTLWYACMYTRWHSHVWKINIKHCLNTNVIQFIRTEHFSASICQGTVRNQNAQTSMI